LIPEKALTWAHLGKAKGNSFWVAVRGEAVDPRAARVAQSKQLCHLVERLAGGVVHGVADDAVVPFPVLVLGGEIKMRMAAGNHERKSRRLGALLCAVLQKHRVDVAFQVIHCNQGLAECPGQRLGVSHAHQECSGEPGALGHGDGVEIVQLELGALHCLADDGGNVTQMLARGELRHTSPAGMDVELRRDDTRKGLAALYDHCRSRFIARALDAKNVSCHSPARSNLLS
jgi:hypothetical protein